MRWPVLVDHYSLEPINGIRALLEQIIVPVAVVSNGPVSKMQHSLGLTSLLPFFNDRLFSGYTLGRWKPDPALIHHAAAAMSLPVERCILIEDSLAGAQAGIAAGIPMFYYCADPHNPPLGHPLRCDGAITGIMARTRLDPDARAGAFVVVTTHNASQWRWQKRGNRRRPGEIDGALVNRWRQGERWRRGHWRSKR